MTSLGTVRPQRGSRGSTFQRWARVPVPRLARALPDAFLARPASAPRTPRLLAPSATELSPGRGSAASGACSSPPTRPLPPPSRPLALPGALTRPAAQVLPNFFGLPSAAVAVSGQLAALLDSAVSAPGQVLVEHLVPSGRWRSLSAPHLSSPRSPRAGRRCSGSWPFLLPGAPRAAEPSLRPSSVSS